MGFEHGAHRGRMLSSVEDAFLRLPERRLALTIRLDFVSLPNKMSWIGALIQDFAYGL